MDPGKRNVGGDKMLAAPTKQPPAPRPTRIQHPVLLTIRHLPVIERHPALREDELTAASLENLGVVNEVASLGIGGPPGGDALAIPCPTCDVGAPGANHAEFDPTACSPGGSERHENLSTTAATARAVDVSRHLSIGSCSGRATPHLLRNLREACCTGGACQAAGDCEPG